MRYFGIGANLRWLMSTIEWPTINGGEAYVQELKNTFLSTYGDSASGALLAGVDIFGSRQSKASYNEKYEVPLEKDIFDGIVKLLNTRSGLRYHAIHESGPMLTRESNPCHFVLGRGQKLPHIESERQRVRYARDNRKTGNCYIIFRNPLSPEFGASPGKIEEIYLHRRKEGVNMIEEPFLVVRRYKALNPLDQKHDPYRSFPDLETQLFYDCLEEERCVIGLDDVCSHFAAFKYVPEGVQKECIVVRPLNRFVAYSSISDADYSQ